MTAWLYAHLLAIAIVTLLAFAFAVWMRYEFRHPYEMPTSEINWKQCADCKIYFNGPMTQTVRPFIPANQISHGKCPSCCKLWKFQLSQRTDKATAKD